MVAQLLNLKVVEMPVKLKLDRHFKAGDAARMFWDVLGIAYRLRVKHFYQRAIYARRDGTDL